MPTPNPHATLAVMVLATVVVVSCSTGAHATPRTIYASSTAGSDSNSGLSPSSAVRTLGRVNSMQLTAQDTLLLRAGDRWCGEQLVLAPPAASAPGTLTVATFNGTAQATLGLSSLIPASFPAPAPGTPDPAAVVVARNFPAGSGLAMDNLVLTAADFGLVASTIASLNLTRMVFLDIRNRSTIGQSNPTPGQRDCANGWTPAVYLSNVGGSSISVERSLFVDIDVAFQVMGPPTASSRFVGNTVTGASGNTVMAINRFGSGGSGGVCCCGKGLEGVVLLAAASFSSRQPSRLQRGLSNQRQRVHQRPRHPLLPVWWVCQAWRPVALLCDTRADHASNPHRHHRCDDWRDHSQRQHHRE